MQKKPPGLTNEQEQQPVNTFMTEKVLTLLNSLESCRRAEQATGKYEAEMC